MKKFGVAYAAFQGEIQTGSLNKAGTAFVGEKEIVTDEVLFAVGEYIKDHGNMAVTFDKNGRTLTLRIRVVEPGVSRHKTEDIEETAIRVHQFSREQWANLPSDQRIAYTREIKRVVMAYEGILNAMDVTEEPEHG